MSDLDAAAQRITGWLQPLPDDAAPCGPDLEYDNDFLALSQAAAGKPESQFGAAEPPDWRRARELAEELLDKSRDLRLAIYWLRANLRLAGYGALAPGLQLIEGLFENLWDGVHPQPDPDDGSLYGRVNALSMLRDHDAVLGDLRASFVVQDRAVGELTLRGVELAAALSEPLEGEAVPTLESSRQLVLAAIERDPAIRDRALQAAASLARIEAIASERIGYDAPDLAPVRGLVDAAAALAQVEAEAMADGEGEAGADGGPRRALSGSVASRADALRAIDMVCEYLERNEPTNPAPLFLRRARQLVGHNFLQLMKELAPTALPDVARMVGVDPESVQTPERS